ncbi:MAG: hypothetical protein IEMM0001_1911 [bacterium]|nr:MAG: hypothetical protein IEMM0001_1911 [bacterium]HDZ77863.1 hypothetical protein [Gammaproteobacteria bacterium]
MPKILTPYDWYASILREESPLFSDLDSNVSEEALWQAGLENGVTVLVNHKLANSEALESLPQTYREKLHKYTLNAVATELGQEHELQMVLSLFTDAGIPFLLMKGTPLAYTHYPQLYLRSRSDTDLLFENMDDAEKAFNLLETHGYQRPNAVSGEFVSHEFCCYKKDKAGVGSTLDMHWKLSNAHRFARAFNFTELAASSTQITELGEKAQSLGPIHALLLACMHRIAHKIEGMENRLVWLYDIHLLTEKFSDQQWRQFIILATAKGMCGICLDGIQQSAKILNTDIPEEVKIQLEEGASHEKYSTEMGESQLTMEMSNLRALPGWKERAGLIKERVFPDANYMMVKYDTQKKYLLPYLYLKRAIGGIFKVLGTRS